MAQSGIILTRAGKCLPDKWKVVEVREDGAKYVSTREELSVIDSIDVEKDGKLWLHVSVSRPDRLPSYDDLCFVKKHWIGDDKEAYQVFARREKHVNIDPHCLHLWSRMDGPALPDFTRGGKTI